MGEGLTLARGVAFSGNMVVAMSMASPRICCRSDARFLRMALAVAIASVVGE